MQRYFRSVLAAISSEQRVMAHKPFTPWKGDQLRAALLLFFAPSILALSAYLVPEFRLYAAAAAALSLLLGWRIRSRVQARQHGQEIEATFSSRAIPELEKAGFHVESGRMTRIGDVDLVVRRAGWCATIEIKSYRYWRGRLRDRARQRKARVQARSQKEALGADLAVIWLPKGWPTRLTRVLNWLWPERNPIVVMGTARWLAKEIARHSPPSR